jgi:hypothetical protein
MKLNMFIRAKAQRSQRNPEKPIRRKTKPWDEVLVTISPLRSWRALRDIDFSGINN